MIPRPGLFPGGVSGDLAISGHACSPPSSRVETGLATQVRVWRVFSRTPCAGGCCLSVSACPGPAWVFGPVCAWSRRHCRWTCLMRPMAKRRSRVAFAGPWPVRMRLRSSSKVMSRMWWLASIPQCPRLRAEQALGCCPVLGQAGDAVGRLPGHFPGLDVEGFAVDGEDLACAGKVGVVVQFTGDPYGAFLLASVVGLAFGLDEVRRTAGHDLVRASG